MGWLTLLVQLVGHVAWPAALVTFVVMFRREIRQRLTAVTEVKYPGGSIIMRDVQRLEASVEEITVPPSVRQLPAGRTKTLPAPHADPRLAIAQVRLDSERELFLLSRHALHREDSASWSVERRLDELEKADAVPSRLADSLREFIAVANKMVHGALVPDELAERASAIGSSLVATLRHQRLVLEAERNFEGHGLWHMHRKGSPESEKHYFWSAVAMSMPELGYDYDVYREAAGLYNQKVGTSHPGPPLYVLSLEEFVAVLEFREAELLRIIGLWESGKGWDSGSRSIEWRWPPEWGDITWNGPILRERVHLWGAEEDLVRTRSALETYRTLFLAERRSAHR